MSIETNSTMIRNIHLNTLCSKIQWEMSYFSNNQHFKIFSLNICFHRTRYIRFMLLSLILLFNFVWSMFVHINSLYQHYFVGTNWKICPLKNLKDVIMKQDKSNLSNVAVYDRFVCKLAKYWHTDTHRPTLWLTGRCQLKMADTMLNVAARSNFQGKALCYRPILTWRPNS